MRMLVTGASGFVGQQLVPEFRAQGYDLSTLSLRDGLPEALDWTGLSTVVHLAGMAHQMKAIDPDTYFEVNERKTLALARAAKENHCKQFIFISTIKVHGVEETSLTGPLKTDAACHPQDPYGASKYRAEEGLLAMEDDNFRVAIVRPPLVYGPGVKGNLQRLMALITKGYPLPLAGIRNKRSMVYVKNLIALIREVANQQQRGIFFAADAYPVSTSLLIEQLISGLDKGGKNFKIPGPMRFFIKKIKPAEYQRLFGSLEIDAADSWARLGKVPPYSFEEGIQDMVAWHKKHQQ